ncbi:MAG TPA: penicillin-binding transpeptidase domain-containing protein [Myxococcota bacterium]
MPSPIGVGGALPSRWRRDQRLRRRLTLRGRATLAALAGGVLVGLTSGIWLASSVGARSLERASDADVASSPPENGEVAQASEVSETTETPEAAEPDAKPAFAEAPLGLSGRLPVTRAALSLPAAPSGESADGPSRLFEIVDSPGEGGPLRIEYSLDAELTRHVFRVLEDGRVALGHVIVLDPATGRVLAYASTDTQRFPATRTYPAASLVKVITAAAALGADPYAARLPCRYSGSPYRLTPARIDPPRSGNVVSLRQALATSNNQCFAQLAVHSVGVEMLMETISRFGWTHEPAPAHDAGTVEDPEGDRFGVGKLGCGLAGCRITPLHAAQLAGALAFGEVVEPRWIDRIVDASGQELSLPPTAAPRQVLSPELAGELRGMLVDTTTRGTARRAFRTRGGRPLLGPVQVAGKTGSLSGSDPKGRYEWFIGVAPAEAPRIAVAVVVVQRARWWRNASQVASEVLRGVFCDRGVCRADAAERLITAPAAAEQALVAQPVAEPPSGSLLD